MKMVLREDIPLRRLGVREVHPDGVGVGTPPPGVGLERLRWDGTGLVDLAALDALWVRPVGSGFELHAVEVPGAQQVTMHYNDRDRLTLVDGAVALRP